MKAAIDLYDLSMNLCQILTSVGVDANNRIYPVAYAIVEAESKASWCWFLSLLGEDLGIEANFNYTFISDRKKVYILLYNLSCVAIESVFPSAKHRYCVRHIHENMKSQFKGGVYKEMLWNVAKATFVGKFNKKMAELKSFNFDAYDWLCSCGKWELTGIPYKHVVAAIYKMSEYSVGVAIPEQWVHAAYRLKTWAHVYSFKVNPCNGRELWPVVEATTVIVPPLYKPQVGRPPKKRKKSHDEIANESCLSNKLYGKGKSVRCGKYGNVGHNMKGCRGQGGATQVAGVRIVSGQGGAKRTDGARNVTGQASARQVVGARTFSGQAGGASNVSSQTAGFSQPIVAQSTSTDARNTSSQPSAAPSITSQGPTQHSAGPRQGFQEPRPGFPTQTLTKAIASRHSPRKLSS
nr:transposase, mutator type [Tanacetum cinerariifolium]